MKRKKAILTVLATALMLAANAQKKSDHNFEVAKNLDIFNNMYKTLDLMYVDTINPGEVIGNGIAAMLGALDPYTKYYPEEKTKELKLFLTGKYAGIGSIVRYHQKHKNVVINEPYEGMPAAEAGLKKGDIILSIDDSTMAGKNVNYVSEHLRGEPGTTFVLKVKRPSTGKTMTFKITRRNIKMPEIPYYGMRDNNIGYICFNQFTEGSTRNVRNAYIDLRKQGAQSLILDLRGNGGGSLSEAVDIINMWIPRDVTIVETKGKLKQANKNYSTRHEPIDTVMPIIVLVNGETASASEIAAGSLQDLDRGIVLGTRTYGKGLVQLPMELPYNSNIKITTSKYYIPSGRCIQAINYKHSNGGYKERIADSLTHVFYTKNGREVRDGGGIKPDIEVKPDTMPNIAVYLGNIDSTEVMFDYVVDYISKHPTIAAPAEFRLTDADFEDFRQRVIKSGFTYDPVSEKQLGELEKLLKFEGYYEGAKDEFEALKAKLKHDVSKDLERNKEVICRMIEQDIISAYYYQGGSIEASLNHDEQVKEAEKLLADPAKYKKLLAKPKQE